MSLKLFQILNDKECVVFDTEKLKHNVVKYTRDNENKLRVALATSGNSSLGKEVVFLCEDTITAPMSTLINAQNAKLDKFICKYGSSGYKLTSEDVARITTELQKFENPKKANYCGYKIDDDLLVVGETARVQYQRLINKAKAIWCDTKTHKVIDEDSNAQKFGSYIEE